MCLCVCVCDCMIATDENVIDSEHTCLRTHVHRAYVLAEAFERTLKEKGLKTPDGQARSAGVSRNWSVLYVSYLEVTFAEGVYKLYVVYRRQRSEILGTGQARDDGCN